MVEKTSNEMLFCFKSLFSPFVLTIIKDAQLMIFSLNDFYFLSNQTTTMLKTLDNGYDISCIMLPKEDENNIIN